MSEQRDNAGIMFPNFGKKKPNHPDFTGTALIGGVAYKISGWEKQGRRTKFFSIAFTVATAALPPGQPEQLAADQGGSTEKPPEGLTAENVPW